MPSIEVIEAGALTTVQDLGRAGRGRFGISRSGAMDPWALRVANLLVNNPENTAALEITGPGATLRLYGSGVICILGGDLDARLNDTRVETGHVVPFTDRAQLTFARRLSGFRVVLAVRGGLKVREAFGSCATDVAAGIPRARVRKGDMFEVPLEGQRAPSAGSPPTRPPRALTKSLCGPNEAEAALRCVLTAAAPAGLFPLRLLVGPCNRTGYRLQPLEEVAPRAPVVHGTPEGRSEPLAPGALQWPPGGTPILLLADHPTLGGYPVMAHLAAVDFSAAAQVAPGDVVRLVPISVAAAQQAARLREREIQELKRRLRRYSEDT